jgi:2,3-dihydroxybiphenyl 1,2-dioxygenase
MSTSFLRPNTDGSVFGAVHLGYVVVESQRLADWRRFGADAIGLHVDELTRDVMRFRLDDRECRFLIQRGPAEDLMAMGWHVDDHETFDRIISRVSERGVLIAEGTPEEACLRGVERLWRFAGPKGIVQEIFTTPLTTPKPLHMVGSGWVTGEKGMGHVAITTRDPLGLHAYFHTVFDSRVSDFIDEKIGPLTLKIRFLRVNERHHSVAIANVQGLKVDPFRTKAQHINIQAASLEDMVAAYQRVQDLGFRMAWDVGQHTNDKALSFYCVTPSDFQLEVGWDPVIVAPEQEATWEPTTYEGISIWGHTPVGETVVTKLHQFKTALRSTRHEEATVPELSGAVR